MDNMISCSFGLFPIAFTIHNIEEAFWMPAYSKSAGKFHKPVNTFEFVFALIVITLFSIIITIFLYYNGKESLACYLFFAFNFGMLINVFYPHLIATIFLKKYCPGLITGIIFLLPTTAYILIYGYHNQYYTFPKFWIITIPFLALVVGSIPVLFKIGKYLQRKFFANVTIKNVP
ncbi:MAG: HXXEE domain-containing protein [Candidatus Hodarchaeota archaeon]